MDSIIQLLKEASELLDSQIKNTSAGMRVVARESYASARMKIQEAITKLLEIS